MYSEIILMHKYASKQTDHVRASFYNAPYVYSLVVLFLNIVNFVLSVGDQRCFNRRGQTGLYYTL